MLQIPRLGIKPHPRFGCDFSGVRVHTDAKPADSAQAVQALAYTVGRDIVFGAGQFSPQDGAARRLLAHALTHVLQQDGGSANAIQTRPATERPGDPLEEEADRTANAMMGPSTLRTEQRLGGSLPWKPLSWRNAFESWGRIQPRPAAKLCWGGSHWRHGGRSVGLFHGTSPGGWGERQRGDSHRQNAPSALQSVRPVTKAEWHPKKAVISCW
jgi:hypothetical protein